MNAHPTQQPPVRAERPGAMTTAMQAVRSTATGPKVLRIGVIQGESIVEERIIRTRETVTVGSSERNHFVETGAELSTRFELFQLVGTDYVLNFTDAMRGRVGLPGTVQDLTQLRTGGRARNAGSHFQVKLNDNSRGKIVIGATTLLFQFVSLPAVQPRPQLPAATRGGLVRSIDWLFTAFVMFTFMSAFGFIVYLENYDAPVDRGIAALPDSIAEILFDEPPPPIEASADPAPDVDPTPHADTNDAPTPPSQYAQSKPSPADVNRPQLDAEAVARLAKEAAQQADALIVGALSAATDGMFADVLAGGAVVGGAEELMAQATGIGVASSSSGGELRTHSGGAGGSGQLDGLSSLIRRGGIEATTDRGEGRTMVERVVGHAKLGGDGGDIGGVGEFDSAIVTNMIKLRMGAIKACYERSLKQNPALAGKVTVEFTIVPAGTVTASRVAANTTGDDSVARCVVSTIDSLRFKPGPQGGNVVYAFPFVFSPAN